METMNKLMTLDGLIERLQEIRECIGHDCKVDVQVNRGTKYSKGRLEMVASDYCNGEDSVLIDIDYDTLKWFER